MDVTTNPALGATDAVTLPLANLVACGKLNKFDASPKNEPVNEDVIDDAVISFAPTLSLISTEPVNSCLSINSSPNLFEPDEYITEEEI